MSHQRQHRLNNIVGDPDGFWNHLLWSKTATDEPAPNNIMFVKLTAVGVGGEAGRGEVIEATFDNHFKLIVKGTREEDGTYVFHFAEETDRATFNPETMSLQFTSGAAWFPVFPRSSSTSRKKKQHKHKLRQPDPNMQAAVEEYPTPTATSITATNEQKMFFFGGGLVIIGLCLLALWVRRVPR